jgi:hypothetical protein
MALEAHILLDGTDKVKSHTKLGDAMGELNAASFAGIGGVVVIGVGKTQDEAHARVVGFTGEEPTEIA